MYRPTRALDPQRRELGGTPEAWRPREPEGGYRLKRTVKVVRVEECHGLGVGASAASMSHLVREWQSRRPRREAQQFSELPSRHLGHQATSRQG